MRRRAFARLRNALPRLVRRRLFGLARLRLRGLGREPAGVGRRTGSRVLLVKIGVGLQEAARDEVAKKPLIARLAQRGACARRRVGKPQQQRRDLRLGDIAALQRVGDSAETGHLGPGIDRKAVNALEVATEIALVARRPGALRIPRQQRDAANVQAPLVTFDSPG